MERSEHLEKRRIAQEQYEQNPKRCRNCGELLPYYKRENIFCSKSCSASFNNIGVTRYSKAAKFCKKCGAQVSDRHNSYCDQCIAQGVYNKNLSAMHLEDIKNDKSRRKWLLERREHRCEYCGLKEWQGQPIPLELHHEDGDTDNNIEANLKLICPNCHALTHTHRRRNALKNGKRQLTRRKRYADGRTW